MKYWDAKNKKLLTAEEREAQLKAEKEATARTVAEETENTGASAEDVPMMGIEGAKVSTGTKSAKKTKQ